jgi:hypothetical protein
VSSKIWEGATSDGGIIGNGIGPIDILVVAVLLAHHDVVGEVDLDCPIDKVRVLVVAALITHLPRAVVEFLDDVFVLGSLGSPTHNVLLVDLLVDGCVVAVAVGFGLLAGLLELQEFPLQFLAFLLDVPEGLS